MSTDRSNAAAFERAQRVIPGGVNSPVRAFRAVGGTPRFIRRAEGAYLWDVEGRRYIDFAGGIAVLNTGHTRPEIVAAIKEQLDRFSHTCFQVLAYEPDRAGDLFSIAPRLLMNLADVPSTELVQPGSRVEYRLLLAAPPDVGLARDHPVNNFVGQELRQLVRRELLRVRWRQRRGRGDERQRFALTPVG